MAPTEAQLKIMEENRRKALEKRAAANAARQVNVSSGRINDQNLVPKPATFSANPLSSPRPTLQSPVHLISSSNTPRMISQAGLKPPPNVSNLSNSATKSASKPLAPSSNQSRPVAAFQLFSRSKFTVDAPFDNQMIEIFKKFPNKIYDGVNRRWTFNLSDHQQLLQSLNPLLPRFQLQPLPKLVLDIFRQAPAQKKITEVDLSPIDPKLCQSLLPFQREGVSFGVHLKGRVLIADDMGLGKTLQALALAHYYLSDWPLLIVTPSSMKFSWEESVRNWLPSVPLHHIQVLCSGKDYIDKDAAVTICSYDLLGRKQKALADLQYKTIIFDESHSVKSKNSQRSKAASAVSAKAIRVILLSGTPALSRPEELYSQLQLLEHNPPFGGFHSFGVRYCGGKETHFGWNYSGATNMSELRLILEERYMIRRLKSEVLGQLPSKQRKMIILDPSAIKGNTTKMTSMASQMDKKFSNATEKRGALLSYYAETAKAKSVGVCDYVTELLDDGRKFLCFAHHHSLLTDLCQCIEKKSVRYIKIDGSVSAEDRKRLCDDFQLKDSVRVAVLSITAANAGLTLTAANLVVFAELFWNPGVLTQAEDRAHRIGQKDSVVIQYLVAKGTADDYLWPLVQSKLDVLSQAGLSKDNFHEADATQLSNPKQNNIMAMFEELSEEDRTALAEVVDEEDYQPQRKRTKAL